MTWRAEWRALRRVARRATGVRFRRLVPGSPFPLVDLYRPSPLLLALFAEGYPESALVVGERAFFPDLAALRRLRWSDPRWPAHAWPLSGPDAEGTRLVLDLPSGRVLDGPRGPVAFPDLAAFLAALREALAAPV